MQFEIITIGIQSGIDLWFVTYNFCKSSAELMCLNTKRFSIFKISEIISHLKLYRRYLLEEPALHQCMQGNPRNIKRIFNMLSLTASVIKAFQEIVS